MITAAGQGSRMGLELPKQFIKIGPRGETILETTVKIFDDCPAVDEILITANRIISRRPENSAHLFARCGGLWRAAESGRILYARVCAALLMTA